MGSGAGGGGGEGERGADSATLSAGGSPPGIFHTRQAVPLLFLFLFLFLFFFALTVIPGPPLFSLTMDP